MLTVQDTYNLVDRYIKHQINTEEELQASWLACNDIVLRISRKHFYKRQSYGSVQWYTQAQGKSIKQYDRHTERVMMFIQFLTENIDDPVALNIDRYTKRFMWIEFLLTCKCYGINLGINHLPLTKQANTNLVRDTVTMLRIHRDIGFDKPVDEVIIQYSFEQVKKYNKFPTLAKLNLLAQRYVNYLECRRITNPVLASELPDDYFERIPYIPYTEEQYNEDKELVKDVLLDYSVYANT